MAGCAGTSGLAWGWCDVSARFWGPVETGAENARFNPFPLDALDEALYLSTAAPPSDLVARAAIRGGRGVGRVVVEPRPARAKLRRKAG